MPTERRAGMDHPHYRFSALTARAPLRWPNGAPVAFWLLLHLEHWEVAPPPDSHRDPRHTGEFGSFFPDYRAYSARLYGLRIGAFRILALLDRLRLRASVAVNAAAAERYPFLMAEIARRGCEVVALGTHATRMITARMPEAEERAHIRAALDALHGATGRRPAGWHSQDFGNSPRTPRLLAEAGLRYALDWPNDDRPYWLTTDPPTISVPYAADLEDVQLLLHRRVPEPRYPALVHEALDRLSAEPGGRSLGLGLHPWAIGAAHRFRYLEAALAGVADRIARGALWHATTGEIAEAFAAQHPPDHIA